MNAVVVRNACGMWGAGGLGGWGCSIRGQHVCLRGLRNHVVGDNHDLESPHPPTRPQFYPSSPAPAQGLLQG